MRPATAGSSLPWIADQRPPTWLTDCSARLSFAATVTVCAGLAGAVAAGTVPGEGCGAGPWTFTRPVRRRRAATRKWPLRRTLVEANRRQCLAPAGAYSNVSFWPGRAGAALPLIVTGCP
jgi:hypothetical protein